MIEKIIICFEEDTIPNIYNFVLENFLSLSNNSTSLCVVKRVIMRAKTEATLETIINLIVSNFRTIVSHSYSNYAIQVALESWDATRLAAINKLFIGNFYELSSLKYSSNVIEKCLERGGDAMISKFIEEICVKTKLMGNFLLT